MTLDSYSLREGFPGLSRQVAGRQAAYLDAPGGTQVHESVIEAMAGYLRAGGSNLGGAFATSELSERVVAEARSAMADLFGSGDPRTIVFGQNMTSLTFAVSRALARDWRPGDRIVVTRLDHDANVAPWRLAAAERGAVVDEWDIDPETTRLEVERLMPLLGDRTRLLAVTHSSNAFGTVVDLAAAVRAAHEVGALVYVDAVHFAPHGLLDMTGTGADFMVASAYKFYGPHIGVLCGRLEHLERLTAYKVRPAPNEPPDKWETGTQSFESLAGATAAVNYLASLGGDGSRRERLISAMELVDQHESFLGRRFLSGISRMKGVRLFGVDSMEGRVPTFAIDLAGKSPAEVAGELGRRGVFVWSGNYYAWEPMHRMGLEERGGLVRIGFVHINTAEEVDRVLDELSSL